MGRFWIQLLLEDNTWSTRYNISKNDRYSDLSTQWTKLSWNFTEENYGIKLIFDEIDSAHSDMSFSNIMITTFYLLNEIFYRSVWIYTWFWKNSGINIFNSKWEKIITRDWF